MQEQPPDPNHPQDLLEPIPGFPELSELIMGALLSRGGRSIHGVLSRKLMNDGNWVSSIVPRFKDPAITSVPRAMSDFVVTEYGVAKLMGKTERERANELIAIAHPDFREELKKEMQKLL
ncbi:MAG: acetyl-CoA hydrolase/transferase C-terminal domain-containing protein [Spirochaetota bacterium]|nr:acetyl-CoA hydrolase/transferase C-terminal domain-containing protein [Spirochaetota bacterium]